MTGGQPDGPCVRVRGIYATALTALLLEHGFAVVDPSAALRHRFRLPAGSGPPDASVFDRFDRQGVLVQGQAEAVRAVAEMLQRALPDPVGCRMESAPGLERLAFEFPSTVKLALDDVRRTLL